MYSRHFCYIIIFIFHDLMQEGENISFSNEGYGFMSICVQTVLLFN